MTRAGFFGSTAALLILTITICLTTLLSGWASERQGEFSHRLLRIQAREWCLGAESLPKGGVLIVGRWQITRSLDGSVHASGPAGTYAIDRHGAETWTTATGAAR